jgi:hypothetical protein
LHRTTETAQECNTEETLDTPHDKRQRQDKRGRARQARDEARDEAREEAKDKRENKREKKAKLRHAELRRVESGVSWLMVRL